VFTLRIKVFLTLATLSLILTASFYIYTVNSFRHNFNQYIIEKEIRFATSLINDLEANYKQYRNWEWIDDWQDYLNSIFNNPPPETPGNLPKQAGHPPVKFMGAMPPPHVWSEITLLDKNRLSVHGDLSKLNSIAVMLKSDGEPIGFLIIPKNPSLQDLKDAEFLELQLKKLGVSLAITLFVAFIVSIPLAHLLTRRINIINQFIGQLSKGNFKNKLSIRGKDEISALAEHINNLTSTLDKANEVRCQLAADISHELRTPVAVLKAELESLEDGIRRLDKQAIHRLTIHTKRLEHLISDLYDLSITDLGGMAYKKEVMSLTDSVEDAIQSMRMEFEKKQIDLHLIGSAHSIYLLADKRRILQLLTGLLKNSLDYTNSPGVTYVIINKSENSVQIHIEDSAPGVTDEQLPKLFDRLYRGDASRSRAAGGAGLGLSICKNIVEAHQGDIQLGHSDFGGLKVTLSLPCYNQ
jgi:two-component system, OmpR family, sensor histidine kinase BaeS